jgi:2-polyprenyl-3-methyl-5-hydroxy-6-metoxy-1,4-benzoquinol methylase
MSGDLYDNYSTINSHIRNVFDEGYYRKTASEYHQLYAGFMPGAKDANILDIGCGNGMFLYYLKAQGYTRYFGIDADNSSLGIVRNHISTQVQNISAVDFLRDKENTYDLVIMNEVLEHIPKEEIVPLIRQIHRSLKPGGIYISYVPNMENPFTNYTRYHDFTHTIGFTQNSLQMVMRMGGFSDVTVSGTDPGRIKGVKKKLKRTLQNFVKKILINLFEYPGNGILHSMRIFSVAKKTTA